MYAAPARGGRRGAVDLVAAALSGIFVVLGITGYAETRPDEYTSQAVVSFSPRDSATLTADTIQVLSSKYVAFLTSSATVHSAAEQTGENPAVMEDAMAVTIEPGTANLSIAVTMRSSRRSAEVANDLAARIVRRASVDELLIGELVAPGIVPNAPSGPPRRLIEIAGLMAGALCAYLTWLFSTRLRGRGGRARVEETPQIAERRKRGSSSEAHAVEPRTTSLG